MAVGEIFRPHVPITNAGAVSLEVAVAASPKQDTISNKKTRLRVNVPILKDGSPVICWRGLGCTRLLFEEPKTMALCK